jgi:hypothetical protein
MSFEYRVTWLPKIKFLPLTVLQEELVQSGHYEAIPVTYADLGLRVAATRRRQRMPEDIVLWYGAEILRIAIHAGSRDDRLRFISDLKTVAERHNYILSAEEE